MWKNQSLLDSGSAWSPQYRVLGEQHTIMYAVWHSAPCEAAVLGAKIAANTDGSLEQTVLSRQDRLPMKTKISELTFCNPFSSFSDE